MILVLVVGAVVCVLPGYFWARLAWPVSKSEGRTGRAGRLVLAAALSLALVPALSLGLARLFGGGVGLAVAVASVVLVFVAGFVTERFFGAAGDREMQGVSFFYGGPPVLGGASLALIALALLVVLVVDFVYFGAFWSATDCWGWGGPLCEASGEAQRFMVPVAAALTLAGLVYLRGVRKGRSDAADTAVQRGEAENVASPVEGPSVEGPSGWRRFLLPVVLGVVLIRGYSGVVLFDWPFIRGVDHYSHAVMANRMMFEGRIEPYLIYPSGFHLLIADMSRISGLDPLDIYPVLGPALTVLPSLALFVLARLVWNWRVGVAAAFFGGLVIGGPYYYLNDSMYPNLVASQFLLVLAVAALVRLYREPSFRSGALFAALGSSVVLYHSVAALYLGLLLAAVSPVALPYLFFKRGERRTAIVLFLSLVALSVVSFLYAWDTYNLPTVIYSALGFGETSGTGTAVDMAVGTQNPFRTDYLFGTIVSQPVTWLALVGVLLASGVFLREREAAPKLALLTLILWSLVIVAGSLTSLSGFPQRFGRDLGVPLSLFAAYALVSLLRSVPYPLPRPRFLLGSVGGLALLAVLLFGVLGGFRVVQGFEQAATPSWRMTTTPEISAAGAWLQRNNTGGNIMVGPERTQVPSRMMLAMGDYSALQSFTELNIERNRDLPPTGPGPLRDVLTVMKEAEGPEARRLIQEYDVRYIVTFKDMPDRSVEGYSWRFRANPELYDKVFENPDVVIFAPRPEPLALSPTGANP
ncbi:hypothetical protein [Rubrobacter indicoceani]|uniref:hypothetical protein n=1 Tax=Rubrobacter indicoceani TaxID=2051957 RepID=UPI000E5B4406|nr:hypothetical protein [Rubrobacter indicoceani]